MAQFNAGYPDLMQRFVIFGIFAIGLQHSVRPDGLSVVWSRGLSWVSDLIRQFGCIKLLSMNVIPAIVLSIVVAGLFSLLIGYHFAAAVGHLFLDPDAGLCANVFQSGLFGFDPDHQW